MTKVIKAQKVYKKGRAYAGTIKVQDVLLEPGATYQVTITKI